MDEKEYHGEMEIITKKGKEIKVSKCRPIRNCPGAERLGTAYKLPDGGLSMFPRSSATKPGYVVETAFRCL